MDNVAELEKYKELLDSGAITEDEFRRMKQSLLGLKTDEERERERQAEREEKLKEIEKLREQEAKKREEKEKALAAEQARLEQEKFERERRISQQEAEIKAQQVYAEEKAKEKARLEAAREAEEAKRAEDKVKRAEQMEKVKKSSKVATSFVSKIILWILTVVCFILALSSFMTINQGAAYFLIGCIFLLWAVIACPFITSKVKDAEAFHVYYRYKNWFAVGLFILLIVIFYFMGS